MVVSKDDFAAIVKVIVKEIGGTIAKESIVVLQKGISAGAANGALGILSYMGWCDLVHGGPYRWGTSVSQLPYYDPDVQNQLRFTQPGPGAIFAYLGQPSNVRLPNGKVLSLPPGASTLQAEVIIDSDVPRTLPKLMSDQAYIQIMERCGQILNGITTGVFGTALTTYVAPVEAVAGLAGLGPGEGAAALQTARAVLARQSAPKEK